MSEVTKPVRTILVSQPEPENQKSPFYDLADKHKLKVDFRKFIHVEGITTKEFRRQRVNIAEYTAVILTSRNAIDHFFRLAEDTRTKISQDLKYFCVSEAIALYLQRYTQYRKRKVFFGNGTTKGLETVLKKYRERERFLLPCSNIRTSKIPVFLEENGYNYKESLMYRTVASDLSDLSEIKYDAIVFYSPLGLESLYKNFPNFEQNETRIAAFGPSTCKAVEDNDLRLDIMAPSKESRSMTEAIDRYIKQLKAKK